MSVGGKDLRVGQIWGIPLDYEKGRGWERS